MPLRRAADSILGRTNRLPLWRRHLLAVGFVLLGLLVRWLLDGMWPGGGYPFLIFFFSIVGGASIGPGGCGYVATAGSALACVSFIPSEKLWPMGDWLLPFLVFIAIGGCITALVESLMHALLSLRATERRRALLLVEYRHRTRNDLASIGAMLLLRRRYVQEPEAKAALTEAARHTRELSLVHRRMEHALHDRDDIAVVDAGEFVAQVCTDLAPPVKQVVADSWPLPTERGLQLGLLIHELVNDARAAGADQVQVRFIRSQADFVLAVIDDRAAGADSAVDGLRARMVAGLVRQLRGTASRVPGAAGPGSTALVRFPVVAPSLAPEAVGR